MKKHLDHDLLLKLYEESVDNAAQHNEDVAKKKPELMKKADAALTELFRPLFT